MTKRVLFVLTSTDTTLTGGKTGWYLPEAAHPYYVLSPKYEIDFASLKGANPPVDQPSVQRSKVDVNFLEDPIVKAKPAATKRLSDVSAADYDAIFKFYVGGHGPVIDLASNPVNATLASEAILQAGKITAAVCHGPAALVGAKDAEGVSIFKGRRATCITNAEEDQIKMAKDIPFLVETRIRELGGQFENAPELWGSHVVVDGILITGQNPASSKAIGEAIDRALSA